MTFKPMLSSTVDMTQQRFPCLGSYKLDGIRVTVQNKTLSTRSMKPIPNRFLQRWAAAHPELYGMDGEIIVGPCDKPTTFRTTTSHVMSIDKKNFDFMFYVFDMCDMPNSPYFVRYKHLQGAVIRIPNVAYLPQVSLDTPEEVDAYEAQALEEGFEGIMLRCPHALYKTGRATAIGQELVKVKRHADCEAVVLSVEEGMHNGNTAFTNELGRTARSSHRANKRGLDTLGAFNVRGLNGPFKDVEFSVGTGLDDLERSQLWDVRHTLAGSIIRVRYFPSGGKDRPRHPVFAGFRDELDMSEVA